MLFTDYKSFYYFMETMILNPKIRARPKISRSCVGGKFELVKNFSFFHKTDKKALKYQSTCQKWERIEDSAVHPNQTSRNSL